MRWLLILLLLPAVFAEMDWTKVKADDVQWNKLFQQLENKEEVVLPTGETNKDALLQLQEKLGKRLSVSLDLTQAKELRFKEGKLWHGEFPLPKTLPKDAKVNAEIEKGKPAWRITAGETQIIFDDSMKTSALSLHDTKDGIGVHMDGQKTVFRKEQGTEARVELQERFVVHSNKPFTAGELQVSAGSTVEMNDREYTVTEGSWKVVQDGKIFAALAKPSDVVMENGKLQRVTWKDDAVLQFGGKEITSGKGTFSVHIGGQQPTPQQGVFWISGLGEEYTAAGEGFMRFNDYDKQKKDYFILDLAEKTSFEVVRQQKPLTTVPVTFDYRINLHNPLAYGHVADIHVGDVRFMGRKQAGFFVEEVAQHNFYGDMKGRSIDLLYRDERPALDRHIVIDDRGVNLEEENGYIYKPTEMQTYYAVRDEVNKKQDEIWGQFIAIATSDKSAGEKLQELKTLPVKELTSDAQSTILDRVKALASEAEQQRWSMNWREWVQAWLPKWGRHGVFATRKQDASSFITALEQSSSQGITLEQMVRAQVKREDINPMRGIEDPSREYTIVTNMIQPKVQYIAMPQRGRE